MKLLIDHYGQESQKMMLLEEMAELQKEICKEFRGELNKEAITEEVADVLIMLEQVQMMYDISDIRLLEIANEKLARQLRRIVDEEDWKHEEPTITEDEKAILRNLPAGYKWITRDENSKLYIYQDKPEKCVDVWMSGRGSMFLLYDQRYSPLYLFDHLFKMVKWEKGGRYPKIHPTQKPVPVLKELIEIYTDPYDVVIDPVAGSGSTLRACAELNRSCYGFEIKKEFYTRAKQKMLTNIDVQIL